MSDNPFDPSNRCAECGARATRQNPEGIPGCAQCFPDWPTRAADKRSHYEGVSR